MNLSHLTDSQLHTDFKTLAQKEREILSSVLDHIRETDRRKLYSALGFQSLFHYMVSGLGYSEGSAQRRITAARLINKIPEIQKSLDKGELKLGQINLVSNLMKKESLKSKEKVLKEIKFKTNNETKKIIFRETKTIPKEDKLTRNSETTFELSITIDEETKALLDELSDLQMGTKTELLKEALKIVIEIKKKQKLKSGVISSKVKKEVFKRDQEKCQKCGSTRYLNFDHIKPRALHGSDEIENIRLLCFNCNQRAAIEARLHRHGGGIKAKTNFFT